MPFPKKKPSPSSNKIARKVKPKTVLETKATKEQIVKVVETLAANKKAPHFAQFAEDVIHQWGGSQKFAEALKQIYDQTESVVMRTRILSTIMRMVERNTAMGGSEDDFNLMSDDDLETQAVYLLKKMYGDGRSFSNAKDNLANFGNRRRFGTREGTAAQDSGCAGGAEAGSAEAVRSVGEPEGVSHVDGNGTSGERQ